MSYNWILLVLYIIVIVVFNGIYWGIVVYIDARRRKLKNVVFWTFLSLILNIWGVRIYKIATKRKETFITLSPIGLIFGERTLRIKKQILIVFSIVAGALSLYYFWDIYDHGFHSSTDFDLSESLLQGTFYLIIGSYFIIGLFSKQKTHPLDKHLFGKKRTKYGAMDLSLNKNRKYIFSLLFLIIGMIVFWIIYFSRG